MPSHRNASSNRAVSAYSTTVQRDEGRRSNTQVAVGPLGETGEWIPRFVTPLHNVTPRDDFEDNPRAGGSRP